MKAILKDDILIKLSLDKGVEVGNIPKGVSLDRLRWNGSQLIDLATPRVVYVKHLNYNYFELHIIELPNTHPVYMQYSQRKDLRYNHVTNEIYLANEQVKVNELTQEQIALIKKRILKYLGNNEDVFIKHFAFTAALIVYASQQPQALKDFFDDIAPDIIEAFPLNKWEDILKEFGREIKYYLLDYYNLLDE